MLRSLSLTLAGALAVAMTAAMTAAVLAPTTATAARPAALGAVDTYAGLSFRVPAGLDDRGVPQVLRHRR